MIFPNAYDLNQDRSCAYERRCDSALRWVSGTYGSAGEKAFGRMDVNDVALLGDYARSISIAQYSAGCEPAYIRQGSQLFIRDVNIDSLRTDLAASAANVNQSPCHAMTRAAVE